MPQRGRVVFIRTGEPVTVGAEGDGERVVVMVGERQRFGKNGVMLTADILWCYTPQQGVLYATSWRLR